MNQIIGGLVAKIRLLLEREKGYYVHGSGRVYISPYRLNEIPRLIREYHQLEAERELYKVLGRTTLITDF